MDKWQAIHAFWSSFGLTAYDESSVPDGAGFPRLTYEAGVSDFGNTVPLTASLWYFSTSWAEISQKADEIAKFIGRGGTIFRPGDGWALWVKRSNPFAQRMSDPEDDNTRRIVLQIEAEFLSAD